jgi:pilus assembly protein FimV
VNKQALSLAACIAAGYPGLSSAIGLGDIKSSSHLNQPLSAKIELLSTTAQEANQVQVRLASPDVFNRVGIERPAYLDSLRFSSTMQNGKPVILVSSSQPINEPFVNFLLEVSWPQGQLLKEYTILLDPPVLMQTGAEAGGSAASVRAEPRNIGMVNRVQQQVPAQNTRNNQQTYNLSGEMPPPVQQTTSRSATASSGTTKYRVRSGDTLYKIASKMKPGGVTSDQMMLAIFRANPNAFRKDNINYLKAGAVLQMPGTSQASGVTSQEAKRTVRKHYAEWKKFRSNVATKTVPQNQADKAAATKTQNKASSASKTTTAKNNKNPRLEVMGADKTAQSANAGAGKGNVSAAGNARLADLQKQLALAREALVTKQRENADLKSRVTELESLVNKKNRLIQLKNQQLAKAQNAVSNKPDTGKAEANKATPTPATQSQGRFNNQAKNQQANNPLNKTEVTQPNQTQGRFNNPANNNASSQAQVGKDLPKQIANQANKDAGQVNRSVPPANQQTPAANLNTPEQNLSPAQLAQKRREAMEAENAKQQAETNNTGFKPEKENSLMDLLSSPIVTAAGAGSILLLLLGWLLLSRRKNKPERDPDNTRLDDDFAYDESPAFDTGDDFVAKADDDLSLDELSNDFSAQKTFDDEMSAIKDDELDISIPSDDEFMLADANTEDGSDLDEEDDILQEADVYIVYGLHDQAETELKKAIKDNPEKLEYRHKLLENYLASNNKDAFDQQAEAFLKIDGANKDALWKKVVEMGRKISPDNTLYQADSSSAKGMAGAAVAAAAAGAAGIAATVNAKASDANDAVQEETQTIEESVDNLFDDLADDGQDVMSSMNNELDDAELSMPDDVNLSLDDLDDEFDLDMDDEFSLDDLENELDQNAKMLSSSDDAGDSDDVLFEGDDDNIIDFDSLLPDNPSASTSKTKDDFDLASLSLEVDEQGGLGKILPKDTPYTAKGNQNFNDDMVLEDNVLDFLDLPEEDLDLHDAHISTKLDLARAYLDMGDIEGARSTLEEVIVEGSDAQRMEAEELLHQTG